MLLLRCLLSLLATASGGERLHYGLFGDLHLVRPVAAADGAVLFFSDTAGWTAREEAYAVALADRGQLVVGIDTPAYLTTLGGLKGDCAYPAGHVEEVAHWIERHEQFADYRAPLVLGLGSGAGFAYALAAQAPSGTFAGLVTLGWRESLRLPKPLCRGDAGSATARLAGGVRVVPVARFPAPWLPLPFAPTDAYDGLAALRGSALAALPGLWRAATGTPAAPSPPAVAARVQRWQGRGAPRSDAVAGDVADLPLTEVAPQGRPADRVVVLLTGDGGWAGLDKGVAEVLAQQGVRVVGFSTLRYFWQTRAPQEAADALGRVIAHYAAQAPTARFVVVGYSFGASLAPVVVNRLPLAARARVAAQFLISPDADAVFEIKVGDWFGSARHEGSLPIAPEVLRSPVPVYCVHGEDEDDSACGLLDPAHVRVLALPGGHHYDGDYAALGRLIAERIAP